MKKIAIILIFCFVVAEVQSQNKASSLEQDSVYIQKINLIETWTWCYIPSDTAFMFITNEEEFRKHDCRSKDRIDFEKFNYLLIYVNVAGCKQHEVKIHLEKNLLTQENALNIDIAQVGNCNMSTHSFHSYLVSKEDCKYAPKIVRTFKIVNP